MALFQGCSPDFHVLCSCAPGDNSGKGPDLLLLCSPCQQVSPSNGILFIDLLSNLCTAPLAVWGDSRRATFSAAGMNWRQERMPRQIREYQLVRMLIPHLFVKFICRPSRRKQNVYVGGKVGEESREELVWNPCVATRGKATLTAIGPSLVWPKLAVWEDSCIRGTSNRAANWILHLWICSSVLESEPWGVSLELSQRSPCCLGSPRLMTKIEPNISAVERDIC